jgi:hypothetical protein
MLLSDGLGLDREGAAVTAAIDAALASGLRTADIAAPGGRVIGTGAFTDAVVDAVHC